jgi:hypothetical protein
MLIFALLLALPAISAADSMSVSLTPAEIMHKADSVTAFQDSIREDFCYRVREEAIFNEVDDKGRIKNSDTITAIVTMQGNEEISREILHATRKAEGGKKEGKHEIGVGFSYGDTSLDYSLAEVTDTSYVIAVSPKGDPRKGDIKGTFEIDRLSFTTRRMDFEVPKPEGALKQFSTRIAFEPLEGGLMVMKEMEMRGLAKAFLGIFKVHFTAHIKYSDFEIIR